MRRGCRSAKECGIVSSRWMQEVGDSDEVALHSSRLAVDVFGKVVHGPCFLRLPSASASSGACEAGMGRPAATSPRHRLSSFLLATRVKENFKFWLRWHSDRSWSQGKGNPPLTRLVFRSTSSIPAAGSVAGFVFQGLPRAMGRPGAISCIVPGPAFRLHGTCQAELLVFISL